MFQSISAMLSSSQKSPPSPPCMKATWWSTRSGSSEFRRTCGASSSSSSTCIATTGGSQSLSLAQVVVLLPMTSTHAKPFREEEGCNSTIDVHFAEVEWWVMIMSRVSSWFAFYTNQIIPWNQLNLILFLNKFLNFWILQIISKNYCAHHDLLLWLITIITY